MHRPSATFSVTDAVKEERNNTTSSELRSCVKIEVAVMGRVPNSPYGFCGCKATLNLSSCSYRKAEETADY